MSHTVVIDVQLFIFSSCPPIDSIMRLMTVWRLTGKIIRTAIIDIYICTIKIGSSYDFRFRLFFVF